MPEVVRFGVSIDDRLLARFDQLIEDKGYVNRSEAVRDLIRNALVEDRWSDSDNEIVGTVTLVYDHHTRELSHRLTERPSPAFSNGSRGAGQASIGRQYGRAPDGSTPVRGFRLETLREPPRTPH